MHTLAIIGYGAQARAWAANLQDSRYPLVIFLRKQSPGWCDAYSNDLQTLPLGPKLGDYRHFALLAPDHTHSEFLQVWSKHLPVGSLILLAHGQSFIKEKLGIRFPKLDFALLAPKAIAGEIRRRYQKGENLGACLSLEGVKTDPERQEKFLRTLASQLGLTSLFPSSFQEEAYSDLFSEQSLLCTAIPYMALYSYNKLREKGHSKEIAYMECWMEVKLIADTMVSMGPKKLFQLISPMALMGSESARKLLFNRDYFDKLEKIYQNIDSGEFFQQMESADFNKTKEEVLDFWQQQELTQTHEELKGQL